MTPNSEGLHPIANTTSPDTTADVVFVHGLRGGAHDTWRYGVEGRAGHFFWPKELGIDLPHCAIWSLDYAAGLSHWFGAPGMAIQNRARNLVLKFLNRGIGQRPLVFVTHSLGGLEVKEIIVRSQTRGLADWTTLVSFIRGIVFCGTPHRGSHFATAAEVLSNYLRIQEHVEQMKMGAPGIDTLHDEFITWQRNSGVPVESYVEQIGLFRTRRWLRPLALGLVVPSESGNPNIAGCDCHPISADHLSLVKLSGRDSDVYGGVRRFIGKALIPVAPHPTTVIVPAPAAGSGVVVEAPIVDSHAGVGEWTSWISKLPRRHDSGVFEGREKALADLDILWADAVAEKAGRAQIVSLVAIGGAGKTTVAARWKDALLARAGHGGVERYFDWSFYSQGTHIEGNPANAQTAADSTVFVAAALTFFGDAALADSAAPAWDKGARLAELVAQHRTLLILDGLEPLQHPPGPQQGELKDDALRALFDGLKTRGRGLCLVTTREPIADLATSRATTTPEWRLDHLTDAAGALVLKRHGVTGPEDELQRASAEVKGHALTLSLMGRYLRLAFDPPDIARRDCFHFSEADAETQNGHAFRVFAAYEQWFEAEGREVEVAILRLLGLFDRPATPDCLAALCVAPAIPGLTEPLVGLGERQWNTAIQRLRELDLVETAAWVPGKVSGYGEQEARAEMAAGRQGRTTNLGPPPPFIRPPSSSTLHLSIDAHPLLREYFDAQLRERGSAPAAHARLYAQLCASVPYWPEGRDGLLPLYQAVAHGCKAGRYQRVCQDVYRDRILRGIAAYSMTNLGLYGLDLAAVACFFVEPWQRLAAGLTSDGQAWLLGEAAFSLRALNRLAEAREPMRANLEMLVQQENWGNTAITSSNLSQLELTLGDVPAAEAMATQCVTFADRSGGAFQRMVNRTTHADALHQTGRLEASRTLFVEAEVLQTKRQPGYPLLYSLPGFLYCDLLLATVERVAWRRCIGFQSTGSPDVSPTKPGGKMSLEPAAETVALLTDLAAIERRAVQTLAWATHNRSALLDIALDHLTLGRVHLLRAVLESPNANLLAARTSLDTALITMRQANSSHHLPRALLPYAWLHALAGEWDAARQRLDEAFGLATRGGNAQNGWQDGMRLHLVDTLLHRARLFGRLKDESRRMPGASRPPAEYPWHPRTPTMDLDEAAELIEVCGYHRRDQELADARAALA